MTIALGAVLAANVYRSIGIVILAITVVGFIVYVAVNVLWSGRAEVGSEIELAPNRKEYFDDDELEGPKLDRTLSWGLLFLFVFAVGLPLYWVMEPARQENAAEGFGESFAEEGAALFAPTAEGGFDCAGCHGGMNAEGGTAVYNLEQPDGSIEPVNWKAPALNTVLLRYSREEVEFILTFGRPFSPMPAWGVEGGGPMNEQQIQNLIDYMETIQITPVEAQEQAEANLRDVLGVGEDDEIDYTDAEVGEALFNLGLTDGFAGGAYACGRCHTSGWSYADSLDDLENPGGGAMGPSLRGKGPENQFPPDPSLISDTATVQAAERACRAGRRFEPPVADEGGGESPQAPPEGDEPDEDTTTTTAPPALAEVSTCQDHIDFVTEGSERGVRYGQQGQGTGKMPGFGSRPIEPALFWINKGEQREFTAVDFDGDGTDDIAPEDAPDSTGMLTPEMIEAVVIYERSLE